MAPSRDIEKDSKASEQDVTVLSANKENELWGSTSASHRKLESYHVNLISIGGTIGTALFVYMGEGLTNGGPASLLLAYAWWTSVIWCIAELQKEMVTFWPTDAAFARNASRYVDPAAGFAVGWNMFWNTAALVIFEIVAFSLVISFWAGAAKVSPAVFMAICWVAYAVLNLWDTRFYANAEFSFAIGKILLITGLLVMTFITMLGGNPLHDRFGFRYWKSPGAFTTPYPDHPAGVGRFEGFLFCVMNACFTVAGPDYLSMVAGETRNPRKTLPRAFDNTIYRLVIFFIGSATAIGILVPYNDSTLLAAIAAATPGAGRSPYVVAMKRMTIPVLPHIVNALILTSVFSAGNAYLFCAARQLAQLSRDGHAPKFCGNRNRNGVPYWSVIIALALALLTFCRMSSSAKVVITYITNLVGAAQLVNWIIMSYTWIKWDKGLRAQGLKHTIPVRGKFLPYGAWYALFCSIFAILMQGYFIFLKGAWDTPSFFFAYTMPIVYAVLFVGWKLIKGTKWVKSIDMDLVSFINDPEFDEQVYVDVPRGKYSEAWHRFLRTFF
ncbi:hypothetical protein T439DRAFT_322887 [Meredithblackwellia eburnea MCA 4105]